MTFGFAKIWERQQGQGETGLNDFEAKSDAIEEDANFWAKILEQSKKDEEAKAARMESGRGVRRKATKTAGIRLYFLCALLSRPCRHTRRIPSNPF
jgi:hypothetical protein